MDGRRLPQIDVDMPFNPFVNKDGFIHGYYEATKTLVLLPLFVFRMVGFITSVVATLAFTKIALLGSYDSLLTRPLPKWRRILLWPVRFLARFCLFLCGFHWIVVQGSPARRRDAPILVCNHVTFVEPVYLFFKHLPVIVTAEENLYFPVLGSILSAMQPIVIQRGSKDSRHSASVEIRKRSKSSGWNTVLIFPEATTTNGRALVSFKPGAFTVPIQPMVVRFPYVHLDPSWVDVGPSIYYLLFRLMTQFHNYMEVEYLPVMEPTFQEQQNPRAFAERVRASMAKALNVVTTEHTFDDLAMVSEARRAKAEVSLLEFGRFEKLYGLTSKEAKRYFHKFRVLDVRKKGMVNLDDLVDYLELPPVEPVCKLYNLFDSRGSGYFNFRQYTAGLLSIVRFERFQEATDAVFSLWDSDGDGRLSGSDLNVGLSGIIPEIKPDQVKILWDRMNTRGSSLLHRIEFLKFMEKNPEYLATLLYAKPGVLSSAGNIHLSVD